MAATIGNARSHLRGRWAISEGISDPNKTEIAIRQSIRKEIRQKLGSRLGSFRPHSNFMHESGTIMQPDYVGKPEDLYLWCLIRESKTCRQYACPRTLEPTRKGAGGHTQDTARPAKVLGSVQARRNRGGCAPWITIIMILSSVSNPLLPLSSN
jgi:hypothetical protein